MLDYYIYVLKKVSFDTILFSKELKKAMGVLTPIEIIILGEWFSVFTIKNPNLQYLSIQFFKVKF